MAYGETYEQFVEKFKPKKTTDDCMTPPEIYEVVCDYVCNRWDISQRVWCVLSGREKIMKHMTIQKIL